MILGNALQRVADEAHAARRQILAPAEIIEDLAGRGVGVERVDREIAPCRILAPVVGEGDGRVSPVGRHIAAQRRHFDRRPIRQHGGDRAVRKTGRHRLDPRGAQQVDHILGRMPRRQIDVGHVDTQHRVAHRAADEARVARPQHRA